GQFAAGPICAAPVHADDRAVGVLSRRGRESTPGSRPRAMMATGQADREQAMERIRRGLGLLLASGVLLLAACVSPGGHGGHPGGYGQAPGGYPSSWGHHVQGTVEGLDQSYGRILLVVDDPRSGRAGRKEVRYDQRTRLFHQGREAAVEGLERGDV